MHYHLTSLLQRFEGYRNTYLGERGDDGINNQGENDQSSRDRAEAMDDSQHCLLRPPSSFGLLRRYFVFTGDAGRD